MVENYSSILNTGNDTENENNNNYDNGDGNGNGDDNDNIKSIKVLFKIYKKICQHHNDDFIDLMDVFVTNVMVNLYVKCYDAQDDQGNTFVHNLLILGVNCKKYTTIKKIKLLVMKIFKHAL